VTDVATACNGGPHFYGQDREPSERLGPGRASARPYSSTLARLPDPQSPLTGAMPTARSTAATTSSRAGQQRSIARPFASYGLAWPDAPRGLAHAPPIRCFPACSDERMRLLGPRRGPRAPDARRKDGVPSHERRHPPDALRRVPGTAGNIGYWFRTPRGCRAQMPKICRCPTAEANDLPCGLMDAAQVADCLHTSKASVLRLIERQKILAGPHKYQSRLFSSSRKTNSPMVRIPPSSM